MRHSFSKYSIVSPLRKIYHEIEEFSKFVSQDQVCSAHRGTLYPPKIA